MKQVSVLGNRHSRRSVLGRWVVALLLLLLVACGGGNNSNPGNGSGSTQGNNWDVGRWDEARWQ